MDQREGRTPVSLFRVLDRVEVIVAHSVCLFQSNRQNSQTLQLRFSCFRYVCPKLKPRVRLQRYRVLRT